MGSLPDFSGHTMVAISTEQNIVNLLPAVQWGVRSVILLASPLAQQKGWSEGLSSVLRGRGVAVEVRPFSAEQDSIVALAEWLSRQQLPERRVWNLGGGLKSQQIALWRVLETRVGDWAVYPGTEGNTILVEVTGQGLVEQTVETRVLGGDHPLRIEEVVGTFARKLVPPKTREKSPVESIPRGMARNELERFRASQEHRRRWYRQHVAALPPGEPVASTARDLHGQLGVRAEGPFKQRILEILDRTPRGTPLKNLTNSLFNGLFEPVTWNRVWATPSLAPMASEFGENLLWPRYFECLVQTLVSEELARTERFSREVLFNVKVARNESLELFDQEHDALLMNRSGTLVSLDAKTASSDAKDLNSRILQFERTSGRLARFSVVIPLFVEDLEMEECKVIRKIPFDLARIQQNFLVLSNETERFFLAPPEEPEAPPRRAEKGAPGAVECRPLESLFR